MITSTADGVVIDVRVIPRAAKPGIAGTRAGALLVRLKAPPVEGAANEELIELLARTAGVPRRSVSILSGDRGRGKRVAIEGISARDAARAFTARENVDVNTGSITDAAYVARVRAERDELESEGAADAATAAAGLPGGRRSPRTTR